jgi:hypothetical protein
MALAGFAPAPLTGPLMKTATAGDRRDQGEGDDGLGGEDPLGPRWPLHSGRLTTRPFSNGHQLGLGRRPAGEALVSFS